MVVFGVDTPRNYFFVNEEQFVKYMSHLGELDIRNPVYKFNLSQCIFQILYYFEES